jgi:hypothetical protein
MSSPSPDSEEHNIEDIIGGYYMFFQSLAELRDTIETAGDIGLHSRSTLHSLLDHLEGTQSHLSYAPVAGYNCCHI